MKPSNIILIVLIVVLVLILLSLTCTSDTFKNMVISYGYKLPVAGTVPNLMAATVPRMKTRYEVSSSEEPTSSEEPKNPRNPSSSEEPASSEEGWIKPAPDQSRLLKNLYHYERKDMRFGELRAVSDAIKVKAIEEEESLSYRLQNISNSMFL